MSASNASPELTKLETILIKRENLIADHDWRDRDAAAHLQELVAVSQEISNWHTTHCVNLDKELEHYLNQCSFAKALAYCRGARGHRP